MPRRPCTNTTRALPLTPNGKIDRAKLDYRPTAKQRSTLELMQYLSMMGPALVQVALAGAFDPAAWTVVENAAKARDLDQTMAAIAEHADAYARLLADVSDADLRARDAAWGLRCLSDVAVQAEAVGLALGEQVAMPANNRLLVFGRGQIRTRH